tara:strand:- start:145 stop:369 length:225 start_codon:yes stop_codon:yes gene_type:complete
MLFDLLDGIGNQIWRINPDREAATFWQQVAEEYPYVADSLRQSVGAAATGITIAQSKPGAFAAYSPKISCAGNT